MTDSKDRRIAKLETMLDNAEYTLKQVSMLYNAQLRSTAVVNVKSEPRMPDNTGGQLDHLLFHEATQMSTGYTGVIIAISNNRTVLIAKGKEDGGFTAGIDVSIFDLIVNFNQTNFKEWPWIL